MNLSVDGKHSVSVQSDDPAAATEGLLWAKKTWGQLLRLPGKPFQSLSEGSVEQPDNAPPGDASAQQHEPPDAEPPICATHGIPMVRVNGRKGPFWSCHQKNDDGSWCSYKPPGA